jgi:hypothetical protein
MTVVGRAPPIGRRREGDEAVMRQGRRGDPYCGRSLRAAAPESFGHRPMLEPLLGKRGSFYPSAIERPVSTWIRQLTAS